MMSKRKPQTTAEAVEEFERSLLVLRDALGWQRFRAWALRHPKLLVAPMFIWPALTLALLVQVMLETT